MKRLTLAFLCALLLLFPSFPVVALEFPVTSAKCALLMDAKTGEVLFEKDKNARVPMASTTKIMTALVVLEHVDAAELVTVSREAVGVEGSSIYLFEGEKISVRDLLFALLLESANDAATALALHTAGSMENFALLMNEKALSLGLSDTQFVNAHGLSAPTHYSSAYDLAMLMREALKNNDFAALVSAKHHTVPLAQHGAAHYFRNHNRLLFSLDTCIGGKTGYTKEAGRCLVSAARKDGATLICVTLNDPDDWRDHTALFEAGFSQYQSICLAQSGSLSYTQAVVGGTQNTVLLQNAQDFTCAVRGDAREITIRYEVFPFVYAPVTGLDAYDATAPVPSLPLPAGYAVFYLNGNPIGEIPLYYQCSVDCQPYSPTIWERMLKFFGWN